VAVPQPSFTTKEALIETAGVLFADRGLEGTGVRAIAKSGNVNIAAVNYHFGSKENLYLEVIRHVLVQTRCPLAEKLLATRSEWAGDPVRCAENIHLLVDERVGQYLPGANPRWYGRVFIRLLLDPPPAVRQLLDETAMPDLDRLQEVLRCCNPRMTGREAQMWVDSLLGQILHYVFTEDITRLVPIRDTTGDFQERVSRHVSRVMIKGLDLPLPPSLRAHACMESEDAAGEVK
jgi:AcrR family transcriptional regulator